MPYFVAAGGDDGNANYSANGTIVLSTEHLDVGSGYNTSNGVYTAPIKGLYYFHMSLYNNGDMSVTFSKNGATANTQVYEGSDVAPLYYTNHNHHQFGLSCIFEMNANDTMRLKARSVQNVNQLYRGHSMFMGYCIMAR